MWRLWPDLPVFPEKRNSFPGVIIIVIQGFLRRRKKNLSHRDDSDAQLKGTNPELELMTHCHAVKSFEVETFL